MDSVFSLNLKNYRLKNKLTLQEFSEKLQISRTALSAYERGLNEPSLYALLKIASVLDCSIDDLVGISNPKNKLDEIIIDTKKDTVDYQKELKNKLDTLNSLIDKNRRTFEDLSKSQKRSSHLIDELTMSKKRTDRMLDELTMSKKRNDLIFEELKRTINRLSKTEELFKDVSSELISVIDENSSKNDFNTEVSSEITPSLSNLNRSSKKKILSVPLVGEVAAGIPCYATENISEYFNINGNKLCSSKNYFILKLKGDSMDKLFDDKELILVEQTNSANNLDLVIVFLPNNEEATFKRIRFLPDSQTVNLIPESNNPIHKTQTYSLNDLFIIGKVIGPLSDYLIN
ncbi:S24 family peptidase [Clostridium cuniculi]|uniref:S24 family peptidase n=1 Tax=Clostridium cuniculi TaxID=2548455 RepID=UPI0010567E02|nr:S24 family peptidase [Clostridium cuniculi]